MAGSKYFVWGEGVWRELDVSSGRVSGWRRRARFVFVRRGRLQVARRRAVLRALQALGSSQPGAAADGPRLAHRSKSSGRGLKTRAVAEPAPPAPTPGPAPAPNTPAVLHAWEHHHCCAHYNGCITNVRDANPGPAGAAPARSEAATQCASAERGLTISVPHSADSSGEEFATPRAQGRGRARPPAGPRGKARPARAELEELLRAGPAPPPSTDDTAENKGAARPAASRDKKPKLAERKDAAPHSLRARSVAERANEAGTNSNRTAHAPYKRVPTPAAVAPPPPAACGSSPGPHIISKRPSFAGLKEYSNLEDHAIVAWLASGSRASHVKGNVVWKQLQEQFERLTGTWRSWHSLRNRYLRYILPALGSLGLPQAEVSRLRAAAATGCTKNARAASAASAAPAGPARRNSIFKEQAVHSAASRRRPVPSATPPHAPSTSPPPAPSTSPPPAPSTSPPPAPSSHRSPSSLSSTATPTAPPSPSSSSSSSSKEPPASPSVSPVLNGAGVMSASRRSQRLAREAGGGRGAPRRSPRYSEVTRRFAARQRVLVISSDSTASESSAEDGPAQARAPHTRKLFNPNNKL